MSVVLHEKRGNTFWITINRPDKRNAINNEVIAGVAEGWREAEADDEVRIIVLTGAGEKAFSAGGDLQPGQGFAFDLSRPSLPYADLIRMALASTKLSIARINGACLAGGMGLLAMTDFAVAADNARFGLPEVKVGVFPMQVVSLLHRFAPKRVVSEWCMTGEPFDAAEALRNGLVNHIAEPGALDAKLDWMVERLAKSSPTAVRRGKYAMRAMADMSVAEALAYCESQIVLLAMTEDAKEGMAAFAEKRPPVWPGR